MTIAPVATDRPVTTPLIESRKWRWTVEDFLRLGELGFFPGNQKFELIDGEILPMSPPNPPHSGAVNPVYDILKAAFGGDHCVRTEQPILLGPHTQPQPDVAVCVGGAGDYRRRFPVATDVRLIVEVSDSTLAEDRAAKGLLYAGAGIAEYWILNLRDRCLEVYREPDATQYRARRVYVAGESVSPLAAPATLVSVQELLGE